MWRENHTAEERLTYRLENFVVELKKNPMNSYKRASVANVIEDILACELGAQEAENDFRADMRELKTDADVEDALADSQLERDSK
jgi:hypothetical protein